MINGLNKWEQEAYRMLFPQGKPVLDDADILFQHNRGRNIMICKTEAGWEVSLGSSASFGRSLMLLEEAISGGVGSIEESPVYETLGMMLDCSRGAVPTVGTVQRLLQILARMGYRTLQLYMEDICLLPEYPYWGYHRGAYTKEELKDMDRYAAAVGIELVPAVQTLAHLGQPLKWPIFSKLVDTDGILLIGEEETYVLLDCLFARLSETFHSRRINIGMDEAHMVGLGEYLKRNGYQDRLQVMLSHFTRVYEIAHKHGLVPMMWSDMFFRLAAGGEYYEPEIHIDSSVSSSLPEDVSLIYWDYYSENQDIYDRMLHKHKQITDNLVFAGGAWKWRGFGPSNRFSIKLARTAHQSCMKHDVKEVLVTAWGDNGAECALFTVLPTLQYWAELCYGNDKETAIHRRFSLCCAGGELEQFLLLDEPMFTPDNPSPGRCEVNAPRYLFYQDIMCGLFDAHVEPDSYERHFTECEKRLNEAASGSVPEWRDLFEVQARLCSVLKTKCRIGLDIRTAYDVQDKEALGEICCGQLPALRRAVEEFFEAHQCQWNVENKISGYDIIDLRFGGMLRRIDKARARISAYLEGTVETLEELETPLLSYDGKPCGAGGRDIPGPFWHRIVSASNISSI